MIDYTTDNPAFSKKIRIVENDDLVNADNDTAAAKQLLQNDLVLNMRMKQCLGNNPQYGDSENLIVTFDSNDKTAEAWEEVPYIKSRETHKSLFSKLSTMFKNVRYLYKILGTTDISGCGDGTVTGAIKKIPTVTNSAAVTQAGQMALCATERNATISGTLANQIAQLNGNLTWLPIDLSNWQVYSGVDISTAYYCPGIKLVYMIINTEGVLIPNSVPWFVIPPEFRDNVWKRVGNCTYYLSDNNLTTITMSTHLDNASFIYEPQNDHKVMLRYGIHLPGFRHRGFILYHY